MMISITVQQVFVCGTGSDSIDSVVVHSPSYPLDLVYIVYIKSVPAENVSIFSLKNKIQKAATHASFQFNHKRCLCHCCILPRAAPCAPIQSKRRDQIHEIPSSRQLYNHQSLHSIPDSSTSTPPLSNSQLLFKPSNE